MYYKLEALVRVPTKATRCLHPFGVDELMPVCLGDERTDLSTGWPSSQVTVYFTWTCLDVELVCVPHPKLGPVSSVLSPAPLPLSLLSAHNYHEDIASVPLDQAMPLL